MIFWSFSSVYRHFEGRGERKKGLFHPSILGVKKKIFDLLDYAERPIGGVEAISLQR